MSVVNGRFTAKMDEPFVVFIIGMRINNFLAVRKWIPTFREFPPMLKELNQHPEKGFLGGEFFLYSRGPALVQYWRSFEDLEKFARNPDDLHMPAWQRFNRSVGSDGTVGIFHETFIVERGNYEAVYNNMPVFGLAKATGHVRAVDGRETARRHPSRQNHGHENCYEVRFSTLDVLRTPFGSVLVAPKTVADGSNPLTTSHTARTISCKADGSCGMV